MTTVVPDLSATPTNTRNYPAPPEPRLAVDGLSAYYGNHRAIADVSVAFHDRAVTALIGPSGCGKSTFVRCLNRIHEIARGARISGLVLLDGHDIYAAGIAPVAVRRRVGMVFQRANPFPTLSILDDVVSGLHYAGMIHSEAEKLEVAERVLRMAALWDEVKNKLNTPGVMLSGGQQQRLCIARALAIDPEFLLMDEPTAALDPIATLQIEELMMTLAQTYTIIAVTHNMQQAARVSAYTAFMLADTDHVGRLVEIGDTRTMFTHPAEKRTEDYITGRFG